MLLNRQLELVANALYCNNCITRLEILPQKQETYVELM